jgi:hypothetical protein
MVRERAKIDDVIESIRIIIQREEEKNDRDALEIKRLNDKLYLINDFS